MIRGKQRKDGCERWAALLPQNAAQVGVQSWSAWLGREEVLDLSLPHIGIRAGLPSKLEGSCDGVAGQGRRPRVHVCDQVRVWKANFMRPVVEEFRETPGIPDQIRAETFRGRIRDCGLTGTVLFG